MCRCGHGAAYHDAKYNDPQCRLCQETGERSWRHAFAPAEPDAAQEAAMQELIDLRQEMEAEACEGCVHARHGDSPCGAKGCLCGHDVPEPECDCDESFPDPCPGREGIPEAPEEPESGCAHCGGAHEWNDCSAYAEAVRADAPRRPPYAVAYATDDGTQYEVALPGDATVCAQQGALVITHASPIAGLVQIRPMETP